MNYAVDNRKQFHVVRLNETGRVFAIAEDEETARGFVSETNKVLQSIGHEPEVSYGIVPYIKSPTYRPGELVKVLAPEMTIEYRTLKEKYDVLLCTLQAVEGLFVNETAFGVKTREMLARVRDVLAAQR